MKINRIDFGISKSGQKISKFILENSKGNYVVLSDYGCTVLSVCLHDKNKKLTDVCLGYSSLKEYEEHDEYLGACIGRFAGAIKDSAFLINNKKYLLAKNDGTCHMHGGIKGFDKYVWAFRTDDDKVIFNRMSPDMEEGYPGTVQLKVTYNFTDNNELIINYDAVSDQDTVLNLTNHTYFNLSGETDGTILDHSLQVFANEYNETDQNNVPSEVISAVDGTVFDFRKPKVIGEDINRKVLQLEYSHGYDHNYYFGKNDTVKLVSRLLSPKTGIVMNIYTNQSGLQVYTGNLMKGYRGKSGTIYNMRSGICLETQFCPSKEEGLNGHILPILRANQTYNQETKYCFDLI